MLPPSSILKIRLARENSRSRLWQAPGCVATFHIIAHLKYKTTELCTCPLHKYFSILLQTKTQIKYF